MLIPSSLKKGDRIGVVTPARRVDSESLMKGCEMIESWGLKVELGKYAISESNSYLAADDQHRLEDLQLMLDREDIDAIFCARGGYGMTRIVDELDFGSILKKPKWIIGFSDITGLHLKLYKVGVESIHGCMPVQFYKEDYLESVESLRKILFGEMQFQIACKYDSHNRIGKSKGQVVGGNLSLLTDAIGSSCSPVTKGKILILEEIDEPLYKVDRMMTHLKRAGLLDQLSGLIIGHMTDLKDTEFPFDETLQQIVMNKVENLSFPVAFGFPIGHEAPNMAWRHGAEASLLVDATASILQFNWSLTTESPAF